MPREMQSESHSTQCPKCKHTFACGNRRSLSLTGGGLVTDNSVASRLAPALLLPSSCSPHASLISPSVPLTSGYPVAQQFFPPPQAPNADLKQLRDTDQALLQSGWFYEGITFEDSHDMLKDTKVGTFLVRNSSNPKFLFSLSVQTARGPTSVRLNYANGYFSLEAQSHLLMPGFPNVIDLIQYYMQESKRHSKDTNVWVDNQGKCHSPITLDQPLRKRDKPPSLKHLARLAIHKTVQSSGKPRIAPHRELNILPNCLISYLDEYPYAI